MAGSETEGIDNAAATSVMLGHELGSVRKAASTGFAIRLQAGAFG